jgi:outer membrane protein assembly factor BamB
MTDQELLALLAEKSPEDLSEEEIALLRQRLADSAELREAIYQQLRLDACLTAALARVRFSPQDVLKRAQQLEPSSSWSIAAYAALPLAALAIMAAALLVRQVLLDTRSADPTSVAAQNAVADSAGTNSNPAAAEEIHASAAKHPASSQTPAVAEVPSASHAPDAASSAAPAATLPPASAPTPPPVLRAPWHDVLARQEELPSFEQEAFRTFDVQRQLPRASDLAAWFEAVGGHNHRITDVDTQRGKCGQIEGLARLKAPWTSDSALKLSLENYNKLQMHFFHGRQGVTLVYYEDQQYRWAAYATTRQEGKARPETLAVTATDDDRCRRTELRFGGPFEIRHRGQELILSRGNIVLLAAPLAGPPEDVFFEGRAAFHGIELVRTQDDPQPAAPLPVVFETSRPAELPWTNTRPEVAQAQALPDGSLRLAAHKGQQRAECYAPLPVSGLCEVIVELADITPGTSVYLGGEQGAVREVVRFHHDRRTNRLAARVRGNDDAHEETFDDYQDKPTPLVDSRCFVRMLYGCGNFRLCLSADGLHWAQVDMANDNQPPDRRCLGLQVVANRPDTHLTLKRLVMRELAGLSSLAPADVRDRAIAVPLARSLGEWLVEIARRQPAGVDPSQWRRACAVRTLGAGAGRDLAYALLELLLDDAAARKLPAIQQLAALNDAMLVAWDLRDGQAMRVGLPKRYLQLGLRAYEQEGLPPWSSIQEAMMSAPAMTWLRQPESFEQNLRWELIDAAHRGRPQKMLELCRRWRFFQLHQQTPLVEWAEAAARREVPAAVGDSPARMKDGWRPILVEEVSKETYNTVTELAALLEGQAWNDAARLLTGIQPPAAAGVAPWPEDKDLLVSLPVAMRLMQERNEPLRESIRRDYAVLARLRLTQAAAGGDTEAVELIALQFAGTDVAAAAHRWLGDQALASGWFERAIAEYRRAVAADASQEAELAPHIRLASAMVGRDWGAPSSAQVRIGGMELAKEQFETLIAQMRGRAAGTLALTADSASALAPKPSGFQAQTKSRLDGNVGDKPQEEVARRTNQFRVPWACRQIAAVLEGDVLYVSNRFQIAAYHLAGGQRLWQSQPPPGNMQRAQDWAMIAMRPLVEGDRIFARQLYGPNPQIVCLSKADGKLRWAVAQTEREFFVTDPLLIQGQLVALSIAIADTQEGILRWNAIDPATGELLAQRDLVRLRSTWGARACGEVLALDDALVAVLGGVTLSVGARGELRWVRKHVTLPAEEDPQWVLQRYQRPMLDSERLYVAQPGVRAVECLDPRTGARRWLAVIPEVLSMVGLAGGRLIVTTEKGLVALDPHTGKTLWRQALSDLHSFQLCRPESILVARREPLPDRKDVLQTRLVWLDAAGGQELASAVIPQLSDADPRLGPLVVYKDRLWTFFGRGQHEPTRDLVELVPAGEAERPLVADLADDVWLSALAPSLTSAARRVAPAWQLLSGLAGERTGLVAEAHGERDVLGLRTNGAWPVALGRFVAIPAGVKPRLRLRVGNDPGQNWKLEVRFGDAVLHAVDIIDQTHPDRWKMIEVDLSSLAGQSGMLVVSGRFVSGGDQTATYWKALEVVF